MGTRATSLRPGVVLGSYPEGDLPDSSRFAQGVQRLSGALRGLASHRPGRLQRVVRRIGAQQTELAQLSDAELATRLGDLRQRLRMEGLADEVCIGAFALICEQASRVLGMRPYDVQLLGGWVMLQGMVAEMQTGEGKTLTATLPAITAALAGIPVHVVTVNDYLVQRDAALMGALYRALGLTVGVVVEGMSHQQRRAAYACDVVYCTNKQLVFDYLRDRMVRAGSGAVRMRLDGLFGEQGVADKLLLRGLCFAILDEADSVLVDEARTPLIIARSSTDPGQQATYRQALDLAAELELDRDYLIRPGEREVEISPAGEQRLADLALPLAGVWLGKRRREELVRQALVASVLFVRDQHYLVKQGRVQIIDEYTGRTMPDRSWERGLHQLVETKEGCELSGQTETLARISYQRFFRRYLRLGGMTGTAREVVGELWSVYRLSLVTIPTHRPLRRTALVGRVFATERAKWEAVLEQIMDLHAQRRPVLVGTASVAASEHLGALLSTAGVAHRVLNARQDSDEADIIAQAGQPGSVTVATNMAGRGVDIELGPGVAELGGLHVIATERHAAGRIDRQLYGRCGRQGDPGSYQYLVSVQDELVASGWLQRPAALLGSVLGDRSAGLLGKWIVVASQRGAERRHARIRRQLFGLDEQLGRMLAFSGRME